MKSKTEKNKGKNILTFGAGMYMCQEQNDEKIRKYPAGPSAPQCWVKTILPKKNMVGKKRLPTNKNTRFLLPTLVVLLCEQCHQSGIAASMEQKLVNWLDRPADLLWCSAL